MYYKPQIQKERYKTLTLHNSIYILSDLEYAPKLKKE